MRNVGVAFFAVFTLCVSHGASAQTITNADVEHFIEAVTELEQHYSEDLADLQARFKASIAAAPPLNRVGRVAIYRHTYNDLATSEEKRTLNQIFLTAGFGPAENWPGKSDEITAAYLKLQAENGALDTIEALSKSQLPQVTPEVRVQIEQIKILFAAAELTSSHDLDIVRPYLQRLEVAMEDKFVW